MSATKHEQGVVPPHLHDLPASAKLVYLCLDTHGALSAQEIRARTGISKNTARRAISDLEDRDAVLERPDPDDGRRRRYVLTKDLQITP